MVLVCVDYEELFFVLDVEDVFKFEVLMVNEEYFNNMFDYFDIYDY